MGNKYELSRLFFLIPQENVRFHLYINTAPCGDARIFSPHEASHSGRGESENSSKTTKAINQKDITQRYEISKVSLFTEYKIYSDFISYRQCK